MIDHLTLTVSDLARSRSFYEKALGPLGYSVRMEYGGSVGIGDRQKPYFWLKSGGNGAVAQSPMHLAFVALTRKAVDAFHQESLAAGAQDNGQPGPRPHYHKNYYGAFVIDPDGHPIEAVCHMAQNTMKQAATRSVKKKTAPRKAAPKKKTAAPGKKKPAPKRKGR